MKRMIESNQRKMRVLALIISTSGAVTGPDANRVTCAKGSTGVYTVTLNQAFASSTQYIVSADPATAAVNINLSITNSSTFVLNTFAVDGTTPKDSITHVLVIGSDSTSQF